MGRSQSALQYQATVKEEPPACEGPDGLDRLPILVWALLLCALPFYPSQDGPFHLHHGSALLAWISGDPSARALFQLQDGLFTNWTTAIVLGDLQVLLGLSSAWAERIWLMVLVAVWVDAFARLRFQLGTSRLVPWLVLLLFQGRIAHMGYWNFLFATGLGLWAWAREGQAQEKKPWRPDLLGVAAFLVALFSHPFGALLYLALVVTEGFLAGGGKGWRILPLLIPYGVLTAMVVWGSSGGAVHVLAPVWPDFLGRELGPWIEIWRLEALPRFALLALLMFWVWASWPIDRFRGGVRCGFFNTPRRSALVLLSLGAVALASLGPEALGGGSMIRARFALLAWALGLLALPLGRPQRFSGFPTLKLALPFLTAMALAATLTPAAVHCWAVAGEQEALLNRLPHLERGQWVVASRDVEELGRSRWLYQPSVSLGERWVAEHGAFNPFSYPMHTGHFPLAARKRVTSALLDSLKWRPFRVPWEALAGDLDAFVVVAPSADIDEGLVPRLAGTWEAMAVDGEVAGASTGAVVFTSGESQPQEQRTPGLWPTEPLAQRHPIPLNPRLPGQQLEIPLGPAYAHWRWRAFLRLEDGRLVPVDGRWIEPSAGRFDDRGAVRIERWTPPDRPRLLILMPG